jgi:enoyl-CoA hydratase/carnithine racemase
MRMFDTIKLTIGNGLATLLFNRPDQLNAMNDRMMREIIEALKTIGADPSVAVAVVRGEGRAFMAGADIKEYAARTTTEFNHFQHQGTELYELIENSPVPFIAAVNGFALGGGFEIALACDLIIAAESARLGLPEVHLGLIPGGGGIQRLLQRTGLNRLKEIVLLGGSHPAHQFYDWGIVNAVVADDAFDALTEQWVEKLKRRPRQSVAALKELLRPASTELPFATRLDREKAALERLFLTPEAKKLIEAFTAKGTQ